MNWDKLKFWRREKDTVKLPEGLRKLRDANNVLGKQNQKLITIIKKGSDKLLDFNRRG